MVIIDKLKIMLKSKTIISTVFVLFSVFFSGCGLSRSLSNMEPPKSWHSLPKQRELWGLKKISFDVYQKIKIGDLATAIDKDAPQKGVICFICWVNKDSYQACLKIDNGAIVDKSIRKVKLVY